MASQTGEHLCGNGRIAAVPAVFGVSSLQRFPVTACAIRRGCHCMADALVYGGIVTGKAFPRKGYRVAALRKIVKRVARKAFHPRF